MFEERIGTLQGPFFLPEMYTAASFQFAFVFCTPYAVFSTCEYEYEYSTELSTDNTEVYDFP